MSWLLEELKKLRLMNWPLTIVTGLLLVIGVAFVYSACYVSDDQPVRYLYLKQLGWVCVGIVCYVGFALIDYGRMTRVSWWAYAASILLLIMVLVAGVKIYGARRWLKVFGFFLQPSEIAKLSTVLVLAGMLARAGASFESMQSVAMLLAIAGLPALLILKEDLGTAMIFGPVTFVMMFVGRVPMRYLGTLVLVGVIGVASILSILFLPEKLGASKEMQEKYQHMIRVDDYQKDRILVFLKPNADPLGAGWNKMQSQIAVGSGGVWGKGYLKGTQNILGFLPKSVAPTDFIFSVIAEERGFVGSVVLLVLFGTMILAILSTAMGARDGLGRILCVGVVSVIFSHMFINMSMTVGILPVVGLPLPFLSYGGTFMVVMMSSLGIVQSVHIHSGRV